MLNAVLDEANSECVRFREKYDVIFPTRADRISPASRPTAEPRVRDDHTSGKEYRTIIIVARQLTLGGDRLNGVVAGSTG